MLRIWQPINWFMWWHFWRDSYWKRKVEAVWYDRVVTRGSDWPEFRSGNLKELEKVIKEEEQRQVYEDDWDDDIS